MFNKPIHVEKLHNSELSSCTRIAYPKIINYKSIPGSLITPKERRKIIFYLVQTLGASEMTQDRPRNQKIKSRLENHPLMQTPSTHWQSSYLFKTQPLVSLKAEPAHGSHQLNHPGFRSSVIVNSPQVLQCSLHCWAVFSLNTGRLTSSG